MKSVEKYARKIVLYTKSLGKWLILAAVTGILCGFIGSLFHISVDYATNLRGTYPWLLYCLPLAGLAIVAVYKSLHTVGCGTNDIIDAVHIGKPLPATLLPSVFFGTVATHLCGGSTGREGAALQMGGTIGYWSAKLFRVDNRDIRTSTMCGMAAFFSALFGTPLAATMFTIMLISVGCFYHAAFIPCFTSSLVAYGISIWMGISPTRFAVAIPELIPEDLIRVAVLAMLCAWVSSLFCNVLHFAEKQMAKRIPNAWLRALTGGCAIIVLTLICGTTDYNGAGTDIITEAVEHGSARPEAFLLKILFTAITLAAGFKGGEVVPSFFIGSTFGCTVAPLLGLPAGFGAALGLISVFCGATNCPVASIFLSIELFGGNGVLYFALANGISYIFSGYNGLYSSQTILYSKLKAQFINVHTNSYRVGETEPKATDLPGVSE